MAALAQNRDMNEAIVFANYAAALSVTRLGVVESIPKLEEVKEFMQKKRCAL